MSASDASALVFWSRLSLFGFAFVILGVGLEGAEIFARRRANWRKKSGAVHDAIPDWAHLVGDTGWLILIIGLAFEMWGHIRVTDIAGRENARLSSELANAVSLAGQAIKKSAEADERTSSNDLARAELEKQVELLRKENLVLSSKIKERHITAQQKDKLGTVLKNAPRGNICIECDATDAEACHFSGELAEAFRALGFSVTENASIQNSFPRVRVLVRNGEAIPPHASAVVKALGEIGSVPSFEVVDFVNSNLVYINVGTKPLSP